MKLVALALVVIGVAAIATGSCSISHRSDQFACDPQTPCSDGRACVEGLCVASQIDSGVKTDAQPTGDGGTCPAGCTSCDSSTKSCTIDCALNGNACSQQVTCPAGWSCNIACSTSNACRNGVDCLGSKSCTITCSGAQSCRNVSCGGGPCKVDCTGNGSCRNVSCGLSCACDVDCQGSLCVGLMCKPAPPDCTAMTPFGGCTSATAGCNTCP